MSTPQQMFEMYLNAQNVSICSSNLGVQSVDRNTDETFKGIFMQESVKKSEKLFSGWFSKKYYESPFDCTFLYISEDVWKNPEGFIVGKSERLG